MVLTMKTQNLQQKNGMLLTMSQKVITQSVNIGPQDVLRTPPSNVPRTSPKDPI